MVILKGLIHSLNSKTTGKYALLEGFVLIVHKKLSNWLQFIRVLISKETVALRRWSRDECLVYQLEIRVLTFTFRQSEGLTLETSALESLYGGQFNFSYQLC